MSRPRIDVKTKINYDRKDFHKRYLSFTVSIGYKGNKIHIDANGKERLTVTELSYYQEKGDPLKHRPARPFILQAVRSVKGVERIKEYMTKPNASKQGLETLVKKIVEECKDWVRSGNVTPSLKASTIKKKKMNNDIPTVETTMLINELDGWVTRFKNA